MTMKINVFPFTLSLLIGCSVVNANHHRLATLTQSTVVIYSVRSKDTLSSIAQRQLHDKSRWKDIALINPLLKKPYRLKKGDKLLVPSLMDQAKRNSPDSPELYKATNLTHSTQKQELLYHPQIEWDLKAGNQRSIGRLSLLQPLWQNDHELIFLDLIGMADTKDAREGNFGIGYRHLYQERILGLYTFYDRRRSRYGNIMQQMTFGAEWLRESLEFRANIYWPYSKKRPIDSRITGKAVFDGTATTVTLFENHRLETPMHGFDIEVGGHLKNASKLQTFIAYYHFNGNGIPSMNGVRVRARIHLHKALVLEGEYAHDNLRKSQKFLGLRLIMELGERASEKNHVLLHHKMTQQPMRDIDIVSNDSKEEANPVLQEKSAGRYYVIDENGDTFEPSSVVKRSLHEVNHDTGDEACICGVGKYNPFTQAIEGTPMTTTGMAESKHFKLPHDPYSFDASEIDDFKIVEGSPLHVYKTQPQSDMLSPSTARMQQATVAKFRLAQQVAVLLAEKGGVQSTHSARELLDRFIEDELGKPKWRRQRSTLPDATTDLPQPRSYLPFNLAGSLMVQKNRLKTTELTSPKPSEEMTVKNDPLLQELKLRLLTIQARQKAIETGRLNPVKTPPKTTHAPHDPWGVHALLTARDAVIRSPESLKGTPKQLLQGSADTSSDAWLVTQSPGDSFHQLLASPSPVRSRDDSLATLLASPSPFGTPGKHKIKTGGTFNPGTSQSNKKSASRDGSASAPSSPSMTNRRLSFSVSLDEDILLTP